MAYFLKSLDAQSRIRDQTEAFLNKFDIEVAADAVLNQRGIANA